MSTNKYAVSGERLGKLYMATAMVLSGTIGWFVLRTEQPIFNIVFFRCLLGTLGLCTYCAFRGFFIKIHLNARQLIVLILGAVTLSANWCFLFSAYRLTSVGITTVAYNVQPFLLLIASFVIWREKPSHTSILWLTLAFGGLLVLASPWAEHESKAYLRGIMCALAAALLYATSTLLTKELSKVLRPELIAIGHMLIGSFVYYPLADFNHLPCTAVQISAVAILGLVHSTLMYILLYGAYQKAATTSIAILGFIYPFTAVIVDFLAFGKTLTPTQTVGGILIVLSAACYAARIEPRNMLRQALVYSGRNAPPK